LNFDDDEDEEEESEPEPQKKLTPLKITSSKVLEYEQPPVFKKLETTPLKVFTAEGFPAIPKSVALSSNLNSTKKNDSNSKSSGLPPSLASKLATLNAKNNKPPVTNSAQKKENFLYCNEDEIEDISNKYTCPNKGVIVLEKKKSENSEVYSRFKLGSPSMLVNNNNQGDSIDKGKNEALFEFFFVRNFIFFEFM